MFWINIFKKTYKKYRLNLWSMLFYLNINNDYMHFIYIIYIISFWFVLFF